MQELLESLKEQNRQPQSYETWKEICMMLEEIQCIANKDFYEQSFFGNAALNRRMLLDERITQRLTDNVIVYLFTNDILDTRAIVKRDSTLDGITLRDVLYHGLLDGLNVLKFMLNNEINFCSQKYLEQQDKFEKNTLPLVKRIIALTKSKVSLNELAGVNLNFDGNSLQSQFDLVNEIIHTLKSAGKSAELLKVPGYTPGSMRSQVSDGLKCICKSLQIRKDEAGFNISLDAFCEQFLSDEKVILNGLISHLFYDRAHIEAALEQNTLLHFNGQSHSFEDIFRKMIEKLATTPEKYPVAAREQFALRFGLVEADLKERFIVTYIQCEYFQNEKLYSGSKMVKRKSADPLVLLDEQLLLQLTKYSAICFLGEPCTSTFFGYSQKERKEAINALVQALKGDATALVMNRETHLKVLAEGKLGRMLHSTLKDANIGHTLEQLVARLIKSCLSAEQSKFLPNALHSSTS